MTPGLCLLEGMEESCLDFLFKKKLRYPHMSNRNRFSAGNNFCSVSPFRNMPQHFSTCLFFNFSSTFFLLLGGFTKKPQYLCFFCVFYFYVFTRVCMCGCNSPLALFGEPQGEHADPTNWAVYGHFPNFLAQSTKDWQIPEMAKFFLLVLCCSRTHKKLHPFLTYMSILNPKNSQNSQKKGIFSRFW